MKSIGTCTRPDPVQIANCPDVFSADSVAGIIHCMYCVQTLTVVHIANIICRHVCHDDQKLQLRVGGICKWSIILFQHIECHYRYEILYVLQFTQHNE